MNASNRGSGGIGEILGICILVIIAMFVVWYYTGGPERTDTTHPFMQPLAPVSTGDTYGPGIAPAPTN